MRRPWSGARRGGTGGRQAGGCSASVCLSAPLRWASRRAAPWLSCPTHCTGSRPRAAALMWSASRPCAPAQGCWPSLPGARPGGAGGRGAGGCSASVCLSAPPGRASRQAAPSVSCATHCTGSRPRAAVRMRSAGCPCAPPRGFRPAAGTVGVGRRLTAGMRRTAACTVAVAPLSGCLGPLRGGSGPPFPWLASGCPWAGGERGGRGGGGGLPAVPL